MDSLKRFDETLFPDKENFYSNLNMENISDADYKHAQKVWKSFEIKILVISWFICSKRYITTCRFIWRFSQQMYFNVSAWSSSFFISTWISMESMFKIDRSRVRIINWYWLVIYSGRICHAIHRYAAANNKYMKEYNKDNESSYLCIWMQIIDMVGQCLKNYL